MGGCFTLSDDSHGVSHVATNYERLPSFFKIMGIDDLVYFSRSQNTKDERFPGVSIQHEAWAQTGLQSWMLI